MNVGWNRRPQIAREIAREPANEIARASANGGAAAALGDLPAWNLGDLYEGVSDPALKADLDRVAREAEAFAAKWAGKLAQAAGATGDAGLGAAIAEFEAIEETLGRIVSFAGLNYFSDTTDMTAAKFYGDAQGAVTDASSHLLFFPLELNRLDDTLVETCLASDERAAYYRPWIVDLRLDRPHQLEDRIEKLFHEKSITGHAAWNRLFDETMSALKFDIDGEELQIEPALSLLQEPDRETRRKAAKVLSETFGKHIRTFSLITNTLAKDKEISDRWHGFEDIADSRHLANRVERPVVEALVEAVANAAPRLSHRYYAMKAKWLGLEKLEFWDRNAPLPETPQRVIPWSEAEETVLKAYDGFAPEMAEIAGRFFQKNWIDAPVRPGKASGAFAHPTVPSVHPYVLVNYMGKPRDVMTLAHELGHGVHQVLAGGQGPLMASTPLTLAETASVFGEMLTFRRLLAETRDPKERKAMLSQKVEDMLNTVVRQIAFYQFERKVHTARREGELTSDDLGRFWMDVQTDSLGPAVNLSEGYETFWAYIPHFVHSPFYVYAYAFGDCLVNSLYAVYEKTPEGFQDRYFDMLKAGGSKHHSELLAPFGLDASDPEFWARGLGMIEGFIDEIERLDA